MKDTANIEKDAGCTDHSWQMVKCPTCGLESEQPADQAAVNCPNCNETVILQ